MFRSSVSSLCLCSSFSVNKEGNNNQGSFYFLVDEDRYAMKQIYSGGDVQPASSSTINLELTAGQIVRVENAISTAIYGTDSSGVIRSWFTGHLLYAL